MSTVVAEAVTRVFPRRGRSAVVALGGVDVSVPAGAFVAFTGPSGCGKSTLLALLGALDRPTTGRVVLGGLDLTGASGAALARARRDVGFVFQDAPVLRGLPLWQNVTYALVPLGIPARERRDRAAPLLERVGLADRIDDAPEILSGGERQRLGVARAMVDDPALVIADEPTSQLDDDAADRVVELLIGAHAAGHTVIVATHDARLIGHAATVHPMRAGRLA